MGAIFFLSAFLSLVISALILISLFSNGTEFFTDVDWGNVFGASSWNPRQDQFGISTILAGSLIVTGIAMLVAAPLGLGAAVYLSVGLGARAVLGARPAAARAVTRTSGAAMLGIGAFLLVQHTL